MRKVVLVYLFISAILDVSLAQNSGYSTYFTNTSYVLDEWNNGCTGCDFNDASLFTREYWHYQAGYVLFEKLPPPIQTVIHYQNIPCGVNNIFSTYNYSYSCQNSSNLIVDNNYNLLEPRVENGALFMGQGIGDDFELPLTEILTKTYEVTQNNNIVSFEYNISSIQGPYGEHGMEGSNFFVEIVDANDITKVYASYRDIQFSPTYAGKCVSFDLSDHIGKTVNLHLIVKNESPEYILNNLGKCSNGLAGALLRIYNFRMFSENTVNGSNIQSPDIDLNYNPCSAEICIDYTLPVVYFDGVPEYGNVYFEFNAYHDNNSVHFDSEGFNINSDEHTDINGEVDINGKHCFYLSKTEPNFEFEWQAVDFAVKVKSGFRCYISDEIIFFHVGTGQDLKENNDFQLHNNLYSPSLSAHLTNLCSGALPDGGPNDITQLVVRDYEGHYDLDQLELQWSINDGPFEDVPGDQFPDGTDINVVSQTLEFQPLSCEDLDCSNPYSKYTKYQFRLGYPIVDCFNSGSSTTATMATMAYTEPVTVNVYPILREEPYYDSINYPLCFRDNVPVTVVPPCFRGSNGAINIDVDCIVGGGLNSFCANSEVEFYKPNNILPLKKIKTKAIIKIPSGYQLGSGSSVIAVLNNVSFSGNYELPELSTENEEIIFEREFKSWSNQLSSTGQITFQYNLVLINNRTNSTEVFEFEETIPSTQLNNTNKREHCEILSGRPEYTFTLWRDAVQNFSWEEECREYVGEAKATGGTVFFKQNGCCPPGYILDEHGCRSVYTFPSNFIQPYFSWGNEFLIWATDYSRNVPEGFKLVGEEEGRIVCTHLEASTFGYMRKDALNNTFYVEQKCYEDIQLYHADYLLEISVNGLCPGAIDTLIPLQQLPEIPFEFTKDPYFWCEPEPLTIELENGVIDNSFSYEWHAHQGTITGPEPYQRILSPYSCAGGEHIVTVTRNDNSINSEACAVTDTVLVVDFNPPPLVLNQYEDAIGIGASKFRSSWLSDFNDYQVESPNDLVEMFDRNPYASAQAGAYKAYQSYDYLDVRRQFLGRDGAPRTIAGGLTDGEETILETDGVISHPDTNNQTLTKGFAWNHPLLEECAPEWKFNNEITKYNSYNFETENKDILGRHSSALYGYGGQLTTAVAANAQYSEIAFESFEAYGDFGAVGGVDLENEDILIESLTLGETSNEEDDYPHVQRLITFNSSGSLDLEFTLNLDEYSCSGSGSIPRMRLHLFIGKDNIEEALRNKIYTYVFDPNQTGTLPVTLDPSDVNIGDKLYVIVTGFMVNGSCTINAGFLNLTWDLISRNQNVHQFNNTANNFEFVNRNKFGYKESLTPYKVLNAFGKYAIIDQKYEAICTPEDTVINTNTDTITGVGNNTIEIKYLAESLEFECRDKNIVNEVAGDKTTVTIHEDPCGSDNAMIILPEPPGFNLHPDVQYWNGFVYQVHSNDAPFTAQNLNRVQFTEEMAHTGKVSLKILERTNPTDAKVEFEHPDLKLQANKEYIISAWMHTEEMTKKAPSVLQDDHYLMYDIAMYISIGDITDQMFFPTGDIIDGWQRIEAIVKAPEKEGVVSFSFNPMKDLYIDDIRLHPLNGGMQTYVYDLENYRLKATLDHNNYATLYKYDDEGNLFHVAKETAEGIKTIQVSNAYIKPNH